MREQLRNLRWEPAVYEHKAALIERTPAEVASSATLLSEAVLKEHDVYRADFLTVGLDVYNIEAEACGAGIQLPEEGGCPEIAEPLWDLAMLPDRLELPLIPEEGRFSLVLEAGREVTRRLGDRVCVRVATSGPFSIASKLVGTEPLILGLAMDDPAAPRLLDFTTRLAKAWHGMLRQEQLEVIVFDSAAAPPMLSPALYRSVVMPRHRSLLSHLAATGQKDIALVIGGDTTVLAPDLERTGATTLLCDFVCDADDFSRALERPAQTTIRRNINPALLETAVDAHARKTLARSFVQDLLRFPNPVAGTGILPYGFSPGCFHAFREAVEEEIRG